MSNLGDAAQASAIPCRRFFLTLLARPFGFTVPELINDKVSETPGTEKLQRHIVMNGLLYELRMLNAIRCSLLAMC